MIITMPIGLATGEYNKRVKMWLEMGVIPNPNIHAGTLTYGAEEEVFDLLPCTMFAMIDKGCEIEGVALYIKMPTAKLNDVIPVGLNDGGKDSYTDEDGNEQERDYTYRTFRNSNSNRPIKPNIAKDYSRFSTNFHGTPEPISKVKAIWDLNDPDIVIMTAEQYRLLSQCTGWAVAMDDFVPKDWEDDKADLIADIDFCTKMEANRRIVYGLNFPTWAQANDEDPAKKLAAVAIRDKSDDIEDSLTSLSKDKLLQVDIYKESLWT